MNTEQARFNMIEQQIRPWDVLDPKVLALLMHVKREQFVPAQHQGLAFADTELPIGHSQHMLSPKLEAKLIQAAMPSPSDSVLEIGAGVGYLTALIAYSAANVVSFEVHDELAQTAQKNLHAALLDNVSVITGCGFKLSPDLAHTQGRKGWNLIVLGGSLSSESAIPQSLLDSLAVGGRLIGIFGQEGINPMMQAKQLTKSENGTVNAKFLFETTAPALVGASEPTFVF